MRDERILDLVQMASEAEELEQSARLSLTRNADGISWPRLAALTALAAVLTLSFVMWPRAPIPGPPQVVMSHRPRPAPAVVTECPPQTGPMLLAVFHQPDSRCDCVVWQEGSFGDRDVHEIGESELIEAAWRVRCADSSNLMLVVALDGPRELLPTDEESARVLAAGLSIQSEECGVSASCYESHPNEFIPPSVTMVAATLASSGR